MMGMIKLLQKRPSDTQIRIGRILFGLIFMGVLVYNFFFQADPNTIECSLFFGLIPATDETVRMGIKIFIILLGSFALFMGVTNMCLMRKKYMRIILIILGILMFISSKFITPSAGLDVDTLVFVFGFIPLLAGITGKTITSKCLKYGEKINKIRV